MMNILYATVLSCAYLLISTKAMPNTVGYHTTHVKNYKSIKTYRQSTMYELELNHTDAYDEPIRLLHLKGSRSDMGYDYAMMGAKEAVDMAEQFISSIVGDDKTLIFLVFTAADWQWTVLEKHTPQEYLDELDGMDKGSVAAGVSNPTLGTTARRVMVLANMPGDNDHIVFVLLREFLSYASSKEGVESKAPFMIRFREKMTIPEAKTLFASMKVVKKGHNHCSMVAAWGKRTDGGNLLSCRNLDWNKDTGASNYKLVTVWQPSDGKYTHATLGFLGLTGALAGMSSMGITVHEANLESDEIGFEGFPWLLRLRYIMENANSVETAKALWNKTQNTVGFNHMVGSQADAKMNKDNAAVVMETNFVDTAYFGANDWREAALTEKYEGNRVHVGAPLPNAVWRTNHPYDPTILRHFTDPMKMTDWTVRRYFFVHQTLLDYENANMTIGEAQMLNISAIVAGKTRESPYKCVDTDQGDNILSVVFVPAKQALWSAWESGGKSSNKGRPWRCAACSTYVRMDLSQFFKP